MNPYEKQDMETFLIEADLIHQKVKKLANNQMSTQEFDKIQALRAQDLKKRQRAKERRAEQAFDKKKQGRQGKGITKDFANFCRFCHRQYQLPTPVCLRCKKDTMTLQQRQQMLQVMVDEYKTKKKKRQQRKMKWDMWQKTKAMLWKKTSNNYDKWEYFVSDSEQQPQQEPIVPKNDPNFKALEMDVEQRKKKRKQDTEKAQKLKQKGNASMKEGDYQKAMEYYTLALQHIRDMKSIYTNRALAFIKLGKFKKAIKDCTNVIEYMEVFEKVGENLDITFKAFSRRALAYKQRKDYQQALEDVKKALDIHPNDKNALILKKQIEGFIQHTEKIKKLMRENKKPEQQESKKEQDKNEQQNQQENNPTQEEAMMEQKEIVKQLAEQQLKQQKKENPVQEKAPPQEVQALKENLNPIEDIKQKTQNLSRANIEHLMKQFSKKQDLISIFIAAKGIKKSLTQLIQTEECKRQGYLVSKCLRNDGVGQKEVWDFGPEKLHNRITQFLTAESQLSLNRYFILEDIFQVLIPLSLHDKYRQLLNNSAQTHKFVQKTFAQLITKHKKQTELFSSFLIYLGNLCCGESKLRDIFIDENTFKIIINSLFEKVIMRTTSNRSYQDLKKNCYSLFANLLRSQSHRNKFIQFFNDKDEATGKPRWDKLIQEVKLYLRRNDNFVEYIEALLSIFVNATFGNPIEIDELADVLNDRFFINPTNYTPQIIHRSLLTVSRLKYKNTESFPKILKSFSNNLDTYKKIKLDKNPMEHVIRILNIMYMQIQGKGKYTAPLPEKLLRQCKSYLTLEQKNQILFCNSANLFCLMLQIPTNYKEILYRELKPLMKDLITISKDRVGNWRKNSAILLAKLSISQECRQELKKHHGMDVLMSIAKFVK